MHRSAAVATVFVLSGLTLAGCARVATEPSAESANLGTNVCFTNAASTTVDIRFSRADTTRGSGSVSPGGTACGEGTFFVGGDVAGSINAGAPDELSFTASNPWVGAPYLNMGLPKAAIGICTGFGVGETHEMSASSLRVVATRRVDDGWKEFTVVLSDGDGTTKGRDCQIEPL